MYPVSCMLLNHTANTRRNVLKGLTAASAMAIAGCIGEAGDDTQQNDEEYLDAGQSMRFIVPWSPGGGVDIWGREMTSHFENNTGVNFEVENIDGAGSLRGLGQLHASEPDGYTIGGFNSPSSVVAALSDPPNYEISDFEAIIGYSAAPYVLVADPELELDGINSAMDAYEDGEINQIGGLAEGSVSHIQAHAMRETWGLMWDNYIGYDDESQIEAVARGEIPLALGTDSRAEAEITAGDVDLVSVLGSIGTDIYPDAEIAPEDAGVENMDHILQITRALWAPPGTPEDRLERLEDEFEQILFSDEMEQWSEETGETVAHLERDEVDQMLRSGIENLRESIDFDELT